MIINSEQEMLEFGEKIGGNLNVAFRDRPRLTRSGLSEASPVTTGRSERVEKSTLRLPAVIELIGDVGAGKTTFTRGLAQGLGITSPITSPSFTISKSYALPNSNGRLIHYDFYRLPDPGLMLDDLRENLENPNNIIVIEWGESISDLLPNDRIIIKIEYNETGGRNLFFEESKTWASAPERSQEK